MTLFNHSLGEAGFNRKAARLRHAIGWTRLVESRFGQSMSHFIVTNARILQLGWVGNCIGAASVRDGVTTDMRLNIWAFLHVEHTHVVVWLSYVAH